MADNTNAWQSKIQLEDFVEAVTRGVLRAIDAQQGEVSGYLQAPSGPGGIQPPQQGGLQTGFPHGPIIMGIVYNPQLPTAAATGGAGAGKLQ